MDRGAAVITHVKHQGQPMGMILCFQSDGFLFVYQSGLETELERFEPGHFANTMTFHAVYERQLKGLDFLRGDERYKAGWGCQRTPLVRTRIVSPRCCLK